MDDIFSDRISDVPRSFIREILKVALEPSMISFAGGLPNREFFPQEELIAATSKVFERKGRDIFQYSNSEGEQELRGLIAQRYQRRGLDISADNILITSGSQQGLDLLAKTLLNESDGLVIEEPGYLGAIQAFSIFRPEFLPVPVSSEGMDLEVLSDIMASKNPKLIYAVPNFQNPSGITYSETNRIGIASQVKGSDSIFIEDDPYGELRFSGQHRSSFYQLMPENTILLGSFSKVVVPGFRIGWLVAPDDIMEKLVIAKQATDLHTCQFTQNIILQYLKDHNLDDHIARIISAYSGQCEAMLAAIETYFPASVETTRPEGGMFLWAALPEQHSALALFDIAVEAGVVFVPGDPFYINQQNTNTMRLSFSTLDQTSISDGISKLGGAINRLLEA
ncbi:MAG: PLP-dependent aminotransferase family protein [Pseudomonadota bacterium]